MRLAAIGLLLAAAAFAQKIEIESDAAADFSKYHTFNIVNGRLNSRNPSLNSELVRKRLDADIQRYLGAKGLCLCPRAGPTSRRCMPDPRPS